MMTRKHYIFIAKILKKNKASKEMIHDFKIMFAMDNERFNFVKFAEACKWEK
jgi:predicted NodU family carbamoyl transferase